MWVFGRHKKAVKGQRATGARMVRPRFVPVLLSPASIVSSPFSAGLFPRCRVRRLGNTQSIPRAAFLASRNHPSLRFISVSVPAAPRQAAWQYLPRENIPRCSLSGIAIKNAYQASRMPARSSTVSAMRSAPASVSSWRVPKPYSTPTQGMAHSFAPSMS